MKPVWCLLEAEGEQGGELFLCLSSFSWFLLSFSGSLSSFIRNLSSLSSSVSFVSVFFSCFRLFRRGRLLSLSLFTDMLCFSLEGFLLAGGFVCDYFHLV